MSRKLTCEELERRLTELENAESARIVVEETLVQRLEFERMLTEVLSRFAGLSSEEIDEGIDHALNAIGTFVQADRAYVFLFHHEGLMADNSNEWCAQGVPSQMENLRDISVLKEWPWFAEKSRKLDVLHIPDVSEMVSESGLVRERFEARGIHSLLFVPMWVADRLIGFLGFETIGEHKISFVDDNRLFQLMGESLGNAISRKRREKDREKLARSNNMEYLGLLAGGVAHELNNVLAGIVSCPELLLLDLPEDSELRKPIEIIQRSGKKAAAIVQDLLTIAKGAALVKEPFSLNNMIRECLSSREFQKVEQLKPAVLIRTDLDFGLLNINGAMRHIRKVLFNLVSNALQAIEGGGNVSISTRKQYVNMPVNGYDNIVIGEYAVLSVSDDGSGIAADSLGRIFEPFFTRKAMGGSGTGLGLAVVWSIIQDHNGYIDLSSDMTGTTFEIYLPIAREDAPDTLSASIEDYKGNGESVLVIDDVESQREISCRILKRLGYEAVSVSSGEEAIEFLKEHTVDLIVLDMIMEPGMNGRETYEHITKMNPKQKAIILSGFAENKEVEETQRLGAGQFIKKPSTLQEIGSAVKRELAKSV